MQPEELISILVHLSYSDRHFDTSELSYILSVGRHLGVKDHIVESIIKDPFVKDIQLPEAEEDRMTILYYMLFLMKIDRQINDGERELIHHYGFKLGFSRAQINDFLDLMEHYKDGRVPTDEMISIIKRYKN
ncbi:MAG: TerB family tellurite resistance protein [Saprospiraceae bacterium]|nr:TerB family tellurite resistance protein [Saprospiraceae bacterium]